MVPIRYFVVQCGTEWRVEFENKFKNGFKTKKEALKYALDTARKKSQKGMRSEVLVQDVDHIWYTAWATPDGEE